MNAAQSAAHPAGLQAELTANLFGVFLVVTGVFFVLVMGFLGWATLRRDRGDATDRRLRVAVAGWAGAITLSLFGLTIASFFTDRHFAAAAAAAAPVQIKVTAQQWWWDVEYSDPVTHQRFHTANEIRLPVGQNAHITLAADDVIHSLWIPNLAGKQDLIPGRTTDLSLLPQKTGRFRAQCAEFCGLQHALMALDVFAMPPAAFAAWKTHSEQPAPAPTNPEQKRGYALFMDRQCAACHAIAGTPAFGSAGPDLTGVAGRATLAAGSVPNVRPWLERWIFDPQAIKPGNRMPKVPLSKDEISALAAYLETLK